MWSEDLGDSSSCSSNTNTPDSISKARRRGVYFHTPPVMDVLSSSLDTSAVSSPCQVQSADISLGNILPSNPYPSHQSSSNAHSETENHTFDYAEGLAQLNLEDIREKLCFTGSETSVEVVAIQNSKAHQRYEAALATVSSGEISSQNDDDGSKFRDTIHTPLFLPPSRAEGEVFISECEISPRRKRPPATDQQQSIRKIIEVQSSYPALSSATKDEQPDSHYAFEPIGLAVPSRLNESHGHPRPPNTVVGAAARLPQADDSIKPSNGVQHHEEIKTGEPGSGMKKQSSKDIRAKWSSFIRKVKRNRSSEVAP